MKREIHTLLPERYRFIEVLGKGGEGCVQLVEDLARDGALLALKLLAPGVRDGESARRLHGEFLTLARLAHPSLARVRDFDYLPREQGAYFTADYVQGRSILEWYGTRRSSLDTLLGLSAQALSVLWYLHRKGIRHGDVKPQNVLVESLEDDPRRVPRLRLVDFGSAHLRSEVSEKTEFTGTLPYLPQPEALRTGANADLYGLGMTLFHTFVGHLPFALGDDKSLREWWRSGEEAVPSRWSSEVTPLFDELVRRLTASAPERQFRHAGEALEFLRGRLRLSCRDYVPTDYSSTSGGGGIYGRDSLLEDLHSTLSEAATGIVLLVGCPGSGKSSILEALKARLQVSGTPVVHFVSPSDSCARVELVRRAGLLSRTDPMRSGPLTEPDYPGVASPSVPPGNRVHTAAEITARLKAPLILLLDGAGSQPFPAVVRELLRQCAESAGRSRKLAALLVTESAEEVLRELRVPEVLVRRIELEPLRRAALAEMAADYFNVEIVPERVLDLLERDSGGVPQAAWNSLRRLGRAGVAVDFLGELEIPSDLEERLGGVPREAPEAILSFLSMPTRKAFSLLWLVRTAVTSEDAAEVFPEFSVRQWWLHLEQLRRHGLLTATGEARERRYELAAKVDGPRWSAQLELADASRLRAGIVDRLQTAPRSEQRRTPGKVAALARQLSVLGKDSAAARWGLEARRLFARSSHDDEAYELLSEILERAKGRSARSRGLFVVRLRLADLALRLGKTVEGQGCVGPVRADHPTWYRLAARYRKALLLDRLGRARAAYRELERLRDEAAAGGFRLLYLEATARLVRLYFQAGKADAGQACLEAGQDLLDVEVTPGTADKTARSLALMASGEATHGSPARAARFLERACAVALRTGRDDLQWEPLNELAVLHAGQGRLRRAFHLFQEVEKLARSRGERMGHLQALYNQAICSYRLNDLDRAEDLLREARRLSDSLGQHSFSATIWLGLAGVLREKGRHLEAIRLYRRVLRLAVLARRNDRIVSQNNLGEIYLALGRLGRSLEMRRRALGGARELQNRFLLGLALRGMGATLWALGRAGEARAALEECLELEEKSSDSRHKAACLYYLGLIEGKDDRGREEDRDCSRRSLGLLRRALEASRKVGAWTYQEASTLAILDLLVRNGRRRAAQRIVRSRLDDKRSDGTPWLRLPVLTRALAARTGINWPGECGEFYDVLRHGEREGRLWEVFLALGDALRDPRLPPTTGAQLRGRRELLAARLGNRLAAEELAQFRSFWFEPQPSAPPPPERPAGGSGRPLVGDWGSKILEWARGSGDEGSGQAVESVLTSLHGQLNAAGAWVLNDREDDVPVYRSRGSAETPTRVLARGDLLETLRESERVEWVPGGLLASLRASGERFLFVEEPPGGWPDGQRDWIRAEVANTAATLELVFLSASRGKALKKERKSHEATREEARRLSALIQRDKELLDTELISRRLEMIEASRRSDSEADSQETSCRQPVAESRVMKELMSRLPSIASASVPVINLGESGVGKDTFARWIHFLSPRRTKPFLGEICVLPESLLEAELFGFVRGAFTDAVQDHPGLFERAEGGTLYLDEVTSLSPALQARLLRVLETKRVRRLGSETEIQLEFRLVSSSRCVNLDDLRERGLRDDLFYRLQGELLVIPPLRQRGDDIPELVREFLLERAQARKEPVPYVGPATLEKLQSYAWPGNVRQLRNELERALVKNPRELVAELLLVEPLPPATTLKPRTWKFGNLRDARNAFERELLISALKLHDGNASRAAETLEVTRRHLGKLLEKHRIDLRSFKP